MGMEKESDRRRNRRMTSQILVRSKRVLQLENLKVAVEFKNERIDVSMQGQCNQLIFAEFFPGM